MESKESNTAHMVSAPSYDEAMKCSTVPSNQNQMSSPYPSHMMQQHPNYMAHPYPVAPNFQPQPMAQPQMMVMVQPTAAPAPAPASQLLQTINIGGGQATCQSCSKPLRTRIDYHSTISTHLAFLLCCIVCCIPCAPFVYCTESCREPRLKCVSCGRRI